MNVFLTIVSYFVWIYAGFVGGRLYETKLRNGTLPNSKKLKK